MKLGVDAALSYSSESELEGAVATPLRFNQDELYDLIKDLNLSKETYEVIATWLKKKNLQPDTNNTCYCTRENVVLPYFSRENNLVFCSDVGGLLQKNGILQKMQIRMQLRSTMANFYWQFCKKFNMPSAPWWQ